MPLISSLKEDEKVTLDDPRLFNMGDLARILGVNRSFITRMKKSGFKMAGGRSTLVAAHRFLEDCEDFTPSNKKSA